MMAAEEWEFEDVGVVRVPEDANFLGQTATTSTQATTPNWMNAIAQIAQAGSQAYQAYQSTQVKPPQIVMPPSPQVVYQAPPMAPLGAEGTPWTTYALIGGGVLAAGVIVYLLLK